MSYAQMFNQRGQINASSIRDQLTQIAKFAAAYDALPVAVEEPKMSIEEEQRLIDAAIYTQEGKNSLASAMANPIRQNLDYRGIARRLLVVDPVGVGIEPAYERDIDVAALVISENGTGVESRVFGDRVKVATWEIMANPTVRYSEARRRRFNVIDRAVQKSRQEIAAVEDASVFAASDAAAQEVNVPTDINDAGMLKRDLLNIKQQIDGWDLVTAKFLMHIQEFNEILLWGSGGGQGLSGGEFDPVSMREVLQTGLYATLWGADILVSKIVPRGTVYGFADPEFVGVMPIREDITVYPADEPKQNKLGWVVREEIGIGILVPRGVALGRKSFVVDSVDPTNYNQG